MQTYSLFFDIFCLILILLSALYFARKGVIAGLLSLLGTVVAVAVSAFGSRALALPVFERFFRANLVGSLEEAFAQQNALSIDLMLEQMSRLLPPAAQQALLDSLGNVDLSAASLAEKVVTEIVQPVVLPVVSLVLFIIFFLALRMLIGALLHFLRAARGLPFLGTAQKAFGAVAGVCIGALYVALLVIILKQAGAFLDIPFLTPDVLEGSMFFKAFSGFNFLS